MLERSLGREFRGRFCAFARASWMEPGTSTSRVFVCLCVCEMRKLDLILTQVFSSSIKCCESPSWYVSVD